MIVIQEVTHKYDLTKDRTRSLYKQSKTCFTSVNKSVTLAPVYVYIRIGPKFSEEVVFTTLVIISEVHSKNIQKCQLLSLAGVMASGGKK